MNGFEIGEKVICRNVEAVIVSYNRGINYFKCKGVNGEHLPFVNAHEMKKIDEVGK
jgi:hypothetical protein